MKHGSVTEHALTFALIAEPRQRRRRCASCMRQAGVKNYATHVGLANGIALASGCEWHMRLWVRCRGALK
jgi:hypothetical protein